MKIRLLLLLFSLSGILMPSLGQNAPGYKTPFAKNRFGDNWFVALGGGAQSLIGNNDSKAGFEERISVMPTLAVGKWFSPALGLRLKAEGGPLYGFEENGKYKQDLDYYSLHVDGMWNVTNSLGAYNPKRFFHFIPYAGIGFGHRFQLDKDVLPPAVSNRVADYRKAVNALTVHGGLQFGFRLSNRLALNIDLGASVIPDHFDGVAADFNSEAIVSATGGLIIKLGKTDFSVIEPMDHAVIESLNSRVNKLRIEVDDLSKRPASCPDCPDVAPVVINEVNYIANVVFFRINSTKIDPNQQGSIYNTAQFMKESGEKIKVTGYADKETGTSTYNLKLSEKRAKAVAGELVSTYGIPSQNIIIEWKGAEEQPYTNSNWNRVVIMTTE